MRPTKFSSTCFFYPFSACHLYISGKAEAGSAGEQPARNNLIDWNGQKGCGYRLQPLFFSLIIPGDYASKKLILFLSPNIPSSLRAGRK
jgi:hypothetical protein